IAKLRGESQFNGSSGGKTKILIEFSEADLHNPAASKERACSEGLTGLRATTRHITAQIKRMHDMSIEGIFARKVNHPASYCTRNVRVNDRSSALKFICLNGSAHVDPKSCISLVEKFSSQIGGSKLRCGYTDKTEQEAIGAAGNINWNYWNSLICRQVA